MMLDPYRVLDLTDDRGQFAGFLWAQLGAEVIAVEPPGGQRARHLGPFAGDTPDVDASLGHWAHNRGKASAVLADPADLDALAAGADVLFECGAFPVDLDRLRDANPALITVSITPFGQDGPKAGWAATDLTVAAASGTMSLTGDADRPPVRISLPQTGLYAGADAACGALIALHERHRSGLGQHVDVSAQQSFLTATQFQMMAPLVGGESPRRLPGGVQLGPFTIQFVHACADGHVTVTFLFGPMIGPFTARLFAWMHEGGFCDDTLRDKDWVSFAMDVFSGKEPVSELTRGTDAITRAMAAHTKDELLAVALERNLLIAPVTTTRDVLGLDQLHQRGFWDQVGGVRYPGAFVRASATPLPALPPAPKLGADTDRLLAEPSRRPAPPPAAPPRRIGAADRVESTSNRRNVAENDPRPLAGVKVLDFMWALAGPAATRTLADFGATVVRVETSGRADVLRAVHPFIGEEGGQENALQWHSLNANKLGVTLDLSRPEARHVVLDLVRWADVVTESFSPKAMAAWGLGYERLREVNPALVMLSSCLMGQTGPLRSYAGFGTMAAAVAGFYPVTGWPDRMPAGPFTAYTDYISPRFAVAAILAALDHRDRTGEGQYLDFSQLEGSLHLLTTALLDDEVNGRIAGRLGNDDPHLAPHGAYPARGEDRWIAIACETGTQWVALAAEVGRPDLAELDTAERLTRRRELDEVIARWAAAHDVDDLEERLQRRGVPCHRVSTGGDCVADPQLVHRGQFRRAAHPLHGETWVEGPAFRLSRTPAEVRWGGPTFGQHLEDVLGGILGYDTDRIADLVIAGALE